MLEREMFLILGLHSELKLVRRKEEIFPLANTFHVAEIVTRALAKLFSHSVTLFFARLFCYCMSSACSSSSLPLTFLCKSRERL